MNEKRKEKEHEHDDDKTRLDIFGTNCQRNYMRC